MGLILLLRSTYARIDLGRIGRNIDELKRLSGTKVMAVVKADAYGHGMIKVTAEAMKHGVDFFAVATPDEAIELRENFLSPNILVLSDCPEEAYSALIKYKITMTICSDDEIYLIDKTAKKLSMKAMIHIKVDTGMGRIGLRTPEELKHIISAVKKCENVEIKGLFTHFAAADESDKSFTNLQYDRFLNFKKLLLDRGFYPICHASNSAGIIAHSDKHLDMCRMGISMYGYRPSDEVDMSICHLEPAMSLISHITYIKEIEAGETVSYGRIYTADRPTKIATVAIGYADGYRRSLSNKAVAFTKGKRIKQVGRVCMDQIMFDVTGVDVKIGDEVELMCDEFNADDMAKIADTISYEILCGISKRVPRIYI